MDVTKLLTQIKNNEISIEQAEAELKNLPYEDLGFAKLDHHRKVRQGFEEVVYCQGKATPHLVKIYQTLAAEGIDEDYYQRVRRASFGSNLRGLNSFENIAVTLTEGYFHGYDPLRFPEVFESITPEDVAAFLKTNVTAERMVLSRIVPKQ